MSGIRNARYLPATPVLTGAHLTGGPWERSWNGVVDEHTLDVRFFERGAGETMSSGTGSAGAAAAALARGWVRSPVRVLTPAGPLELRVENDDICLEGPAEIVAEGQFFYERGPG